MVVTSYKNGLILFRILGGEIILAIAPYKNHLFISETCNLLIIIIYR